MKLKTPSGGIVEAAGDEAKRLIACGFSPVEPSEPTAKKTAPRKRKTATK
jgi:hypothetical protein